MSFREELATVAMRRSDKTARNNRGTRILTKLLTDGIFIKIPNSKAAPKVNLEFSTTANYFLNYSEATIEVIQRLRGMKPGACTSMYYIK